MTLAREIMRTRVGTIRLTEDCAEDIEVLEGMGITIDLAGHRLTNASKEYAIRNRGNLTITDSVGGGSICCTASGKGCLCNSGPGNTIIKKASFEMGARKGYCIVNTGNLMTIEDIEMKGTGSCAASVRNGFKDEVPDGRSPSMVIKGGRFRGRIPVKNDSFGNMIIYGGDFESANECLLSWSRCTIHGGSFNSTGSYAIYAGMYSEDGGSTIMPGCLGGLRINGGSFSGPKGIIRDLTAEYAPSRNSASPIEVFGGDFDGAIDRKFLGSGISIVKKGERSVADAFGWDVSSLGAAEMQRMTRMVIKASSLAYTPGGIDLPDMGFRPVTVMGASAEGGIMAYYDESVKKLKLYRNGAEASGTIKDITVVLLGL